MPSNEKHRLGTFAGQGGKDEARKYKDYYCNQTTESDNGKLVSVLLGTHMGSRASPRVGLTAAQLSPKGKGQKWKKVNESRIIEVPGRIILLCTGLSTIL